MRVDEAGDGDRAAAVEAPAAERERHLGGQAGLRPDPHDAPVGGGERTIGDQAERSLAERGLAGHQLGEVADDQVGGDHRARSISSLPSGRTVTS